MRSPCGGSSKGWVVLILALALACNSSSGGPQRRSSTGGASRRVSLFKPLPSGQGPRRLPTIANIDWNGFPRESSGKIGFSGRVIKVTSTQTGSIGRAIRGAKPGDTVLISPGTYRVGKIDDEEEGIITTDGLVVRTPPGTRARLLPVQDARVGIWVKASNVLVSGLDLEGFRDAGVSIGDQYKTSRGVILRDITVRGSNDGKWHDGIVAYHDFRKKGAPSSDGLVLYNVNVYDASLGISCNGGPCRSWWLENVKVRNALGAGWGADGIAVESGENIVIVNAEVMAATGDGIDLKASDVLVMSCNVHDVAKNGVKLWKGGDIVNTAIHHLVGEAVWFDAAGRYRFLHSVAADICYRPESRCYAGAAGYDTRGDQQVEVIDSIFYRTHGAFFMGDNTRYTLRNNIFHAVRNGEYLVVRKGQREQKVTTESSAGARRTAGMDGSNRLVDPRFLDMEAGDFRLRSDSPGIDRGTQIDQYPTYDGAGQPRVHGAAPDIGPFEQF